MAHQRGRGQHWTVAFIAAVITAMAGCTSAIPAQDAGSSPTTAVTSAERAAVQAVVRQFFANDLADAYRNRRAVLVSVGKDLLVEDYHQSSATASINIESAGKSIISTLVGIALSEGRLNRVDQTLGELLPSYAPVMSSKTKRITLQQLLTMSAGLPPDDVFYREVLDQPDWVRYIIARGPVTAPGATFEYSSAGSHLLSAILRQATGMPTLEYARQKLFGPLGIPTTPETTIVAKAENLPAYDKARGFVWPVDPRGVHVGGGGQKLTAPDMLKLGRLWLNGGRWEGRQVVPQPWLQDATRAHIKTGVDATPNYGYQFWNVQAHGHPGFAALGYGGQLIEVVPDLSLVVVALSASPSDPRTEAEPGTAQGTDYVTLVDTLIAPIIG